MAVFTAVDGLWLTNGTQSMPFSRMLDWPNTVSIFQLTEAELIHDVGKRRLVFTYPKGSMREALSFYYDRPGGIVVLGPTPWPTDGTGHVTSSGQSLLFSSQDGIVYQENMGTLDLADLEDNGRRITAKQKSQRHFPFGRRHHGMMKELGIYTTRAAPGVSLTVTVRGRREGQPEVARDAAFDLKEPGWHWTVVDLDMESFTIDFKSSERNLPGLVMWDAVYFASGAPRGKGK